MGVTLSSYIRSETPEKFIKRVISEHCVVVFAKTHCPYSQMAKDIFAMLEVPVKTIDIDTRSDGEIIQDTLKNMTKVRTVSDILGHGSNQIHAEPTRGPRSGHCGRHFACGLLRLGRMPINSNPA